VYVCETQKEFEAGDLQSTMPPCLELC